MIKQLFARWFGVDISCQSCEILRLQLEKVDRERHELLNRLLAPPTVVVEKELKEEPVAITPPFIPWRVKQQMLEQEDRVKAKLMKDKAKEIEELENELGLKDAVQK